MADSLGIINPLRYRGYVYDEETQLYYLQSRYYNPEIGRFINADIYISTGQGFVGNNMFAYCINNPVYFCDKAGKAADSYAGMAGEAFGRFLYELFAGESHPSRQTEQLEQQILKEQMEIVGDAASVLWDAYQRGYEMQQMSQYLDACALIEAVEYFMRHPKQAEIISRDIMELGFSALALGTVAIAGAPAVAIGCAAFAVVVELWDLCWDIVAIAEDFE